MIREARRAAEHEAARLRLRLVVQQPAGPANRYEVDPRSGMIVLAGVDTTPGQALVEYGDLERTAESGGEPVQAVVPVRVPTFRGCRIPVSLIGLLQRDCASPLVVAVPSVDPAFSLAREFADLPDQVQQLLCGIAPRCADAAAAEAHVRGATEHYLRTQAAAQAPLVLTWKAGDAKPPTIDGGVTQPHTFAEYAVAYLPARFQEYIARSLLPDERILQFVHRPVTVTGGRGPWRRTLREGLLVLTDRQVLVMEDSTSADHSFVHWGYIARCSAVERVTGAALLQGNHVVVVRITVAAAHGCEQIEFTAPTAAKDALQEAVALLQGFVPQPETRALRRCYERALPTDLPALAEGLGSDGPPSWAQALLPDESLLAWAQAPVDRGPSPAVVVGTHSAVVVGARQAADGPVRVPVAALTTLEMTLSLLGSGLELVASSPRGLERYRVRFDYPAAPPFLTAWTALRHLIGIAPQEGEHEPANTTA